MTIDATSLKSWRESRKLSQLDLGGMLGVSHSAVNRWENGQEIPGPVQMLLRLLIHGEMPFGGGQEDTVKEEAKHFWSLKLTLGDWHKLEGLASSAGFPTVRDYLLHLIREHLEEETSKTLFISNNQDADTVGNECCPPSSSVSTATSCETGPTARSPLASAAPIVPLPTAHWSGTGGGAPAAGAGGEMARQDVVYEKPRRRRKAE